mgnify:FL=1|jgi:DNA polymerase III epsilon subunit-like protein
MLFHLNPQNGVVNRCSAKRQCPYSDEFHYNSIAEARDAYERRMSNQVVNTMSKSSTSNAERIEELFLESRAAKRNMWKLANELKAAEGNPEALASVRWFQTVQKAKQLNFLATAKEREAERYMSSEERAQLQQRRDDQKALNQAKFEDWKRQQEKKNGPYNFHPDITSENEADANQVISSYSGMSTEDVKKQVDDLMATGMTRTEAYRHMWANMSLRTDKPLVSIDLEVAASQESGYVDKGPYSNIIEVGIVKRYPDGRVETMSFMSGVPQDFAKVHGTGAEHVHHISWDEIKDKEVFVNDPEKQTKVLSMLSDSVMVAHNAKFEIGQLQHNLFGFNALQANGLEVLDTRMVSTFFLPETPDNTNKSLVEASGQSYTGAHRALADAEMTLTALLKLKDVD